ncbi:MAG TPA: hypothetical protein VFV70_05515 [Hyphomonadaceae bacterium]|nr:hypothetical protein [Hyphomonadaceae bacterium]
MRGRLLTLLTFTLATAPAAGADPSLVERTFLERTAIAAADAACNLFSEGERLALRSGLYQAEGELLRADYTPQKLENLTAEVRSHARSLGCDHPAVLEVAATVRTSYRQFARTNYLQYAAGSSAWDASRSEHDDWAVKQADKTTGVIIGLRRGEDFEDLRFAVAIPADGRAPSSVQMFVRDAKKMREPWLGPIFGAKTLAPAPRSISRPEWPAEKDEDEDASGNPFYVFYFSKTAIERLELLDPREAVQVDLTPSPIDKDKAPVKVAFEVGDLRAAHAFAMIPKVSASALAAAEPPPSGGH